MLCPYALVALPPPPFLRDVIYEWSIRLKTYYTFVYILFWLVAFEFQAAGRGGEYLDSLEKELDLVTKNKDSSNEQIQVLKEKFPRGGAMGLLEMNPHLVTILFI